MDLPTTVAGQKQVATTEQWLFHSGASKVARLSGVARVVQSKIMLFKTKHETHHRIPEVHTVPSFEGFRLDQRFSPFFPACTHSGRSQWQWINCHREREGVSESPRVDGGHRY